MELLRKYGVQCDVYFPLIVAGAQNFAGSGDYTHASGDVKISKDGGAAATATNSPSVITMGNVSMWKLTITATEMQAALVMVTIGDATTKAVEDQMIIIATYGNASAQHAFDLDTSTVSLGSSGLDSSAITTAAANKIADHTIRRTFQNACDSSDGDTKTGRSLLGAIAKLVNKIAISAGTLTVYEDDDTTSLFTQSATTDAAANPIISLDTA